MDDSTDIQVPCTHTTPESLGSEYEVSRTARERREFGVFYTPAPLIEHLLDEALEPTIRESIAQRGSGAILSLRVCDPSCGSGHFLLAAARRLAAHLQRITGTDHTSAMAAVIRNCIYGVDVDPKATKVCRDALAIASGGRWAGAQIERNVVTGNALDWRRGGFEWETRFGATGFDCIIGNPPYLNQLETATASSRQLASVMAKWSHDAVRGYADSAAAFLLLSIFQTRPGGRVALVLPQSVMSATDARRVRDAAAKHCVLESIWVAGCHAFQGASVYTCAPVLRVGAVPSTNVRRSSGFPPRHVDEVPSTSLASRETWSHLDPHSRDVPAIELEDAEPLASIADATADFRDQYYGLEGFITDQETADSAAFPRLITTGMIDLAKCSWGEVDTRILKHPWRYPRIDRRAMKARGGLSSWIDARLVPKLLLATQTRVLEVIADREGAWLPCVPLITVTPSTHANLNHIGAVLGSPVASAIAFRNYAGAALSIDAIKLSAKQTLTLPIPARSDSWDRAAIAFQDLSRATGAHRQAALEEFGRASIDAYGLPANTRRELFDWWWSRLPDQRGKRSAMKMRSRRMTRPKISVGHSIA